MKSAIVPANSYEGVDYDAQCISTYQGIQVSMDFSQEEGYKFFKAMWEDGKEIWQNAYPVGANNDVPAMTLQAAATPLHAGSSRLSSRRAEASTCSYWASARTVTWASTSPAHPSRVPPGSAR